MEIIFNSKPAEGRLDHEFLSPASQNGTHSQHEPEELSEDEVLSILEEQPSLDGLTVCLAWLTRHHLTAGYLNITLPGPRAARLIHALVNNVVDNFWDIIRSDPRYSNQVKNLIRCLRSVPGLGALILRLKALMVAEKQDEPRSRSTKTHTTSKTALFATRDLLARILFGRDTVSKIVDTVFAFEDKAQQQATWNQAISLLAGGRVLSTLAEADLLVSDSGSDQFKTSLGDGAVYTAWIGENIRNIDVAEANDAYTRSKARAALFGKAISLGYTQQLVETCFAATLSGDELRADVDFAFLRTLKIREQQQVLYTTLWIASTTNYREARKAFIPGLAALLRKWCSADLGKVQPLVQWISGIDRGRTTTDTSVRRAVVTVLAEDNTVLGNVCSQLIKDFGDPVYIRNAPTAQQEVQAENILLTIGKLFQNDVSTINQLLKSSDYINMVSNRLSSSASRPRLLGMFVAVTLSNLAKDGKNRLKFEEVLSKKDELEGFERLVKFSDQIGCIGDLGRRDVSNVVSKPRNITVEGQIDVPLIITARQNEQSEDTESSKSDEDDPTLVNRKKPTPPVYIRDLLRGLNNSEEQDQYQISLLHAAKLIRRKADFGSEVADHLEELAAALASARDTAEKKELADAQLQAMIALIVASSSKMGNWFSISVFAGDYSMSQRISMLTALAFAARELAGYKNEESRTLSVKQQQSMAVEGIPRSQNLPAGLRAFSEQPVASTNPLNILASRLEQDLIQPMAASAADQVAGPDSLKVRTFSSRLKPDRKRQSTISNQLSKVVADCMFLPLVDRFQLEIETRGSSSSFTSPFLLAHFLKTLGLLIAASGPYTLSLPFLTHELLALCLSSRLRQSAIEHLPVLEALLFCLLVLMEVNASDAKRLVIDNGSDLLEAKAWVEIALERISPGDKENERVRTLGAGVLVHCADFINRYQEQMLGRVAEFL